MNEISAKHQAARTKAPASWPRGAMFYLGLALTLALHGQTPSWRATLAERLSIEGAVIDPAAPPLGLKTYLDLGLIVDETTLAREAGQREAEQEPLAVKPGVWTFALFDEGNQVRLAIRRDGETANDANRNDVANALWCSHSKDGGRNWSEPRFLAAMADARAGTAIANLEFRKTSGKTLRVTLTASDGRRIELRFKENDLVRLATLADLRAAPPGRFVLHSVPTEKRRPDLLSDFICVGGDLLMTANRPPAGYRIDPRIGLMMHEAMAGQLVHEAQSSSRTLYESRAVVAPNGDYIMMVPDGIHATSPRPDANTLVTYRSTDQGETWHGPTRPFGVEKHHAALLLSSPRNGIHIFGTQRGAVAKESANGKAFGFRHSKDDGLTWSDVQLARFEDGTVFPGTAVIQVTETDAGTWMAGFHHARVLRGVRTAEGRRWTVTAPTDNVALSGFDELRIIRLKGANALALGRTNFGQLWEMRSADDGASWGQGRATSLIHPDAPPMLFHLSDGKTLIALHHNRRVRRSVHEPIHSRKWRMPTPTSEQVEAGNRNPRSYQDWVSRAEVWFSLSTDDGATWSEPRLMFANALAETLENANPNYQCSYVDLFVDRGFIHLIVPHRWQRVVHLKFDEAKLGEFATRAELEQRLASQGHP